MIQIKCIKFIQTQQYLQNIPHFSRLLINPLKQTTNSQYILNNYSRNFLKNKNVEFQSLLFQAPKISTILLLIKHHINLQFLKNFLCSPFFLHKTSYHHQHNATDQKLNSYNFFNITIIYIYLQQYQNLHMRNSDHGADPSHQHLLPSNQNSQNWRMKSLDPHPLQTYSIPLGLQFNQQRNKSPRSSIHNIHDQFNQEAVPKISKINQHHFCIYLNNYITLFTYMQSNQRKATQGSNAYIKTPITSVALPNDIQCVCGDGSNRIYVHNKFQLVIMQILQKKTIKINQLHRKRLDNIKGLSFLTSNLNNKLILINQHSVYMYDVDKDFKLVKQFPIVFSDESSGFKNINNINGISIVVQSLNTFYFIGTSIQLRSDVHVKLGRQNQARIQQTQKKCQVLYIAKLTLKKEQVQAKLFIIDYIFQIGIFKKSKIYQVGNQTFVLSLYQQIIVIRRNFDRFMVWDNITISSSQNNQKKGQLILADQRIMVYSQNESIYAHQLYFNFDQAKFQTPKIDNFRGNTNQQQILYDALIFEYQDKTFMKVLFYFKETDIYIPNRLLSLSNQQNHQHLSSSTKDQIHFQIMRIQQSQPTQKLKAMLKQHTNPQQIQSFLKRFHIDNDKYKKSQWQISNKGQKQIQAFLFQIQDNHYIESQLTKILKQKSHDLQFLLTIKKKQIQRYKLLLSHKLLKYSQQNQHILNLPNLSPTKQLSLCSISQLFLMRELDQIKLIIQSILQQQMFQLKLNYLISFMLYKQYTFIQISQLKSLTIRQQLKLLTVKGSQKRLKYFLNNFKYLILDNFKQILKYLINDLDQNQLSIFITDNYFFILPQLSNHDICKFWDDQFQTNINSISTIQQFHLQIINHLTKTYNTIPNKQHALPLTKSSQIFTTIFEQFKKDSWFINNAQKQHSLLKHTLPQLQTTFKQLKQNGVINIIVQFMYSKIGQGRYNETRVQEIINQLKNKKFLQQSYTTNIQIRLSVYNLLQKKQKFKKKQYFELIVPKKSAFIILKQQLYFDLLFYNFQQYIIKQIKQIYQNKQKGLFLTSIKQYFNSNLPNPIKLIQFLNYLYDTKNQDIRSEIFQCICKSTDLTNIVNSKKLLQKLSNMQIINKSQPSLLTSIKQNKLAYSTYFINLFTKYNIKQTYSSLLKQSTVKSISQASIIKQLINKYVLSYNPQQQQIIVFQYNKIITQPLPNVDLSQKTDFFSVILYLTSILNYQLTPPVFFKAFIFQFLQQSKFDELKSFINQLNQFGKIYASKLHIQQYPHYRLLDTFKHEYNIKNEFQQTIIQWINIKYKQLVTFITSFQPVIKQQNSIKIVKQYQCQSNIQILVKINSIFLSISSILKILNSYNFNSRVQKQISRISLFETIKKLSPQLLIKYYPTIITQHEKYTNISSFIFLINILHNIQNPSIFNIQKSQLIYQILSLINTIHKQYNVVFSSQNKNKNQDVLFGELCRFHSQFVIYLIDKKIFKFASFILLDLFNTSFFYKDVLFYYLSRVFDPTKIQKKVLQKLIDQFMTIYNPYQLKKIFNTFHTTYQLQLPINPKFIIDNIKTIFIGINKNNQLDQAFFFTIRNCQVHVSEFQTIALSFDKFPKDHITTLALLSSFIRVAKERIQGQNCPTFTIFKRKLSSLFLPIQRMSIIKDILIIMNQLYIDQLTAKLQQSQKPQRSQRHILTEVILDVVPSDKNIKQKQSNHSIAENDKIQHILPTKNTYQSLKKHYEKYMQIQKLNPWLTINTQQLQPTAIRLQKLPQYSLTQAKLSETYLNKYIPPNPNRQQTKQIKDLRKKLFDNQQRLKQIQQQNRQFLSQQLSPKITQIKNNIDKQKTSLSSENISNKFNAIEQKDKQQCTSIFKINQPAEKNQQKDIKVQENSLPTSQILQQTDNFIQQLRQRRKKVHQQNIVTFGSSQDDKAQPQKKLQARKSLFFYQQNPRQNGLDNYKSQMKSSQFLQQKGSTVLGNNRLRYYQGQSKKSMIAVRQQMKQKLDLLKQSHMRGLNLATMNKIFTDKKSQFYVPRWQPKIPLRSLHPQAIQQKQIKPTIQQKLKKQALPDKINKQKQQKTYTIEQLINKYKSINQNYICQMLQKINFVINNPKASIEIIKSIYHQIKDIKKFIQLCKQLLTVSQAVSQFIQYKSLIIVQQSMKTKIPIQLKQIFPSHLFTTVHVSALRNYYPIAYGIIRPSIIKIMQETICNVNALAMTIRYGFGSDATFYFRVYQDYIRSLLSKYQNSTSKLPQQKDLQFLVQKLRCTYSNLNPQTRKIKFEQLIQQIQSVQKKKNQLNYHQIIYKIKVHQLVNKIINNLDLFLPKSNLYQPINDLLDNLLFLPSSIIIIITYYIILYQLIYIYLEQRIQHNQQIHHQKIPSSNSQSKNYKQI